MNRTTEQIIVTRVISEPGDHTRYDYLVLNLGSDYMFMPYGSTLPFPQRIDRWDASDIKTIEEAEAFIIKTASKHSHINPHTMLECINYINETEQL